MNRAKLIKKIRKEIVVVTKEKDQIQGWINERRDCLKSYSNKCSEIIEVNDRIDFCMNNINDLTDFDKKH